VENKISIYLPNSISAGALHLTTLGEAYSTPPDPLAGLKALLLRGGKGRERDG